MAGIYIATYAAYSEREDAGSGELPKRRVERSANIPTRAAAERQRSRQFERA